MKLEDFQPYTIRGSLVGLGIVAIANYIALFIISYIIGCGLKLGFGL